MSMGSVCEVCDIAAERGITWDQIKDMSEDAVYRLFYPDKHRHENVFVEPDWDRIHKEMAKVGVNLRLLHDEYKTECRNSCSIAMGYTKFCEGYGAHVVTNSLTKRIEHKAGVSCEVDWSGPTIGRGLVDPVTSEVSKIYLFVGVLPFSQKAYFEPTLDMKERTWLRCHVHMYEFFGGVPERTVCDNCKTAVVKHPREGEIVLNDAYEALGEHYMTAIMPAQVRKPKQKASAEGTVKDAATWVIAKLRNHVFSDFDEVVAAVRGCLSEYNAHPFHKSRSTHSSNVIRSRSMRVCQ
ncbi:MAG: IS21 family transposase [Gordonibacter sp.]|nr:IS21 family transposase [Gordonibacter sp.]